MECNKENITLYKVIDTALGGTLNRIKKILMYV